MQSLAVRGLAPVSFEVAAGECLAVQGPSGAGKSLLLRAIADLDPAEGAVSLDGTARRTLTGPQWRRRVRYMAADPGWWSESVAAHFADPGAAREGAAALGMPGDILDGPVARLSTGERQRLALLRALEGEPQVLLLDEPTAALDAASTRKAEVLMRKLLKAGRVLLLVSHSPAQVKRLTRRRLLVGGGKARLAAS